MAVCMAVCMVGAGMSGVGIYIYMACMGMCDRLNPAPSFLCTVLRSTVVKSPCKSVGHYFGSAFPNKLPKYSATSNNYSVHQPVLRSPFRLFYNHRIIDYQN